jgi:DNA (cytosine-5)-methyltransferase 1
VLENVCGALTSHGGADFAAIGSALADGGYRFGAVVIDAARFIPQSRPRLFVVAVDAAIEAPASIVASGPEALWHTGALLRAFHKLSRSANAAWIWWGLPRPARRLSVLAEIIEDDPRGVTWHSEVETARLLAMMSRINLAKVADAKKRGRRVVGGIYRRTRPDEQGRKIQRAEVRFDDVSGCLRTPVGGSSRQTVMIVHGSTVRTRLLSPREAARLMGLSDRYVLPGNYNEAYHLAGDGVVVPVVRFLAEHILEPLMRVSDLVRRAA